MIVNDLGCSGDGTGASDRAQHVVAEIEATGGTAVADPGDVSSKDDMDALVDRAIDRFGKIDIVINNAGVDRFVPFHEMTLEVWDLIMRVHVTGSFLLTRAAWPHMMERGYGRVIMTASAGMLGLENDTHYAAAKGALSGLTKALAIEGRDHGITANVIAPYAFTPLSEEVSAEGEAVGESLEDVMTAFAKFDSSPDLVAPAVAWLAHENCRATGELITAGLGWVGRLAVSQSRGFADPDMTIESVRDHWADIIRFESGTEVRDLASALAGLLDAAPPAR